MPKIDLSDLYRSSIAAQAAGELDEDTLARLAAGEHLGARHQAALDVLARSPAQAQAVQVAAVLAPDSERLAGDLARAFGMVPAENVGQRSRLARIGRTWLAIAAGLAAAFAVLVMHGPQGPRPAPSRGAALDSDRILVGEFEDGVAGTTTPARNNDDGIFVDDFGA